jgi:hypothetical protein
MPHREQPTTDRHGDGDRGQERHHGFTVVQRCGQWQQQWDA